MGPITRNLHELDDRIKLLAAEMMRRRIANPPQPVTLLQELANEAHEKVADLKHMRRVQLGQ